MKNRLSPCRFKVPEEEGSRLVVWEITNNCNLACLHCCNNSGSNAHVVDAVALETAIGVLSEFGHLHVREVYFSGGEPLVRPDFLSILSAVDTTVTKAYFASNGTTITHDVASELAKLDVSGISISLDGSSPELHAIVRNSPESFFQAVAGIQRCSDFGLPFRVTSLITEQNLDHLQEFMDLLEELRVPTVVFQSVLAGIGRAADNPHLVLSDSSVYRAASILETMKQRYAGNIEIDARLDDPESQSFRCHAGQQLVHISTDGNVSPCSWLYKADPTRFTLGNVCRESLSACLKRAPAMIEEATKQSSQGCPVELLDS